MAMELDTRGTTDTHEHFYESLCKRIQRWGVVDNRKKKTEMVVDCEPARNCGVVKWRWDEEKKQNLEIQITWKQKKVLKTRK